MFNGSRMFDRNFMLPLFKYFLINFVYLHILLVLTVLKLMEPAIYDVNLNISF